MFQRLLYCFLSPCWKSSCARAINVLMSRCTRDRGGAGCGKVQTFSCLFFRTLLCLSEQSQAHVLWLAVDSGRAEASVPVRMTSVLLFIEVRGASRWRLSILAHIAFPKIFIIVSFSSLGGCPSTFPFGKQGCDANCRLIHFLST